MQAALIARVGLTDATEVWQTDSDTAPQELGNLLPTFVEKPIFALLGNTEHEGRLSVLYGLKGNPCIDTVARRSQQQNWDNDPSFHLEQDTLDTGAPIIGRIGPDNSRI
jgi:hypothetical protein